MSKRPVIGIAYSDTASRDNEMRLRTYVSRKYFRAVYQAGGLPLLLPALDPYLNAELNSSSDVFPGNYDYLVDQYLEMVDGLLMPGGEDVHPRFQGEDPHPRLDLVNPFRDEFELALIKAAYERTYHGRKIPALGICRGVQVIAIALGGAVHQDIGDICSVQHSQKAPRWETSHRVKLCPDSRLANVLTENEIFTNSFHHQSVKAVPKGFRVVAQTADKIVEAIETNEERFFCGVQWHPEETFATDVYSKNLFKALVNEAEKARALR